MAAIRSVSKTLTLSLGLLLGTGVVDNVQAGHHLACPKSTPLSCHNTTAVTNTCCTNVPGGLVLQTQFWDYSPANGPETTWTVHGLWPDNCDGSYQQYCDPNRQYTNITQILQAEGRTPLLNYMNKYWLNLGGTNEAFWEHEWGKHGTCFSTLNPECYANYTAQQEVGQYFAQTVTLYKTLNTYKFLAAAGIVPSSTATYNLSDVHAALTAAHGYDVTVECDSNNAINQVYYYFNVMGAIFGGKYVPTAASSTGGCPSTVLYPPKSSTTSTSTSTGTTSTTSTSTSTGATSTPTSSAISGYMNVVPSGSTSNYGCMISYGTWYYGGTCATYHGTVSNGSYTYSSSKGPCAFNASSAFTCSSAITTPAVFTLNGTTLQYNGDSDFSSAATPAGSVQQAVYPGKGPVTFSINWFPI